MVGKENAKLPQKILFNFAELGLSALQYGTLSVFDSADSSNAPVAEASWKPAIPRYPQLGRHGVTAEPGLEMTRKNPISADLRVTVPGTMRAREYPESRDHETCQ